MSGDSQHRAPVRWEGPCGPEAQTTVPWVCLARMGLTGSIHWTVAVASPAQPDCQPWLHVHDLITREEGRL